MLEITPTPEMVQGAISCAWRDGALYPWRLPVDQLALFPPEHDRLAMRAAQACGVRLRLETDTRRLGLAFDPLLPNVPSVITSQHFDLTIDDALVASADAHEGSTSVCFDDLPAGRKVLEVWLPMGAPVGLRTLTIDDGASCRFALDTRPRWVTYGSSITHCVRAHSPARTWPSMVARRRGLHLTALGYGGECHLEPMVALMLRDTTADLFTLKLGINCIGGSLSPRTFPSAVIGLVRIIRERHRRTPIVLISPIAHPPRETAPNILGYTLWQMRADIADAHRRLVEYGDDHLWYVDGLTIFDEELIGQYAPDELHPNADGIELMADRFDAAVMALPGTRSLATTAG